ncbi:MAG: NAD(P)-dependent glycerol-3-phosphate dehydrogenase [Acidobacteria bacterium]|nr:NAD(P)-dependent glycerol-3-phosphate dehydrogenase [Acidobacteriota bacterium]
MALRVAVVGAGSWGTTVASLSAVNNHTMLWARRKQVADEVVTERTNTTYLPGVELPSSLSATSSLEEAVRDAEVIVMAVPSHGFRAVLEQAAPHARAGIPVVSLAKGLEPGTRLRMTEVISRVLPGHPAGALTGPNLAREIAAGQPAAAVMAFADEEVARSLQPVFHAAAFRVYTNLDIVGCEIAGVVKNVIAIAAGMVEGMGFGDNTKATVMTRGLAELTRLGVALGGDRRTFAGLAGMGDLVATCASEQSRNHRVGIQLGTGRPLAEILAATPMIAEGVGSSPVVCELASASGVEMPLAEQVRSVCAGESTVPAAVEALLRRPPTSE